MPFGNPLATPTTQHIPPHVPRTELLGLQLRETRHLKAKHLITAEVLQPQGQHRPGDRRLQPGGNCRGFEVAAGNHPRGLQSRHLQVFPLPSVLQQTLVHHKAALPASLIPPLPGHKSPKPAACPIHGEDSKSIYRITDHIGLCTPPFPLHHV